jgi:hypothetical protein
MPAPSAPGPIETRTGSGVNVAGILTAVGGLALLVWVVERVGLAKIAADVRQVGWGLVAIIAIGGLRFLARSIAWQIALDPEHALGPGAAFAAVICGDAIGNLTPLGPLVGEPAKAAFARKHVPLAAAVAALAVENVLYTLSAAAMIAAGMAVLIVEYEVPAALQSAGEITLASTAVLFGAALWLLWRQPPIVSRTIGIAPRLRRHVDGIRDLERSVYSFASRRPGALAGMALAEISFHALGVCEIYVTLWLLYGRPPGLLSAFILETCNRLIIVVFKFVPLRLGVDEAVTALFTQVLGLGANTGVAIAIIRKLRVLFWTAAGGAVMMKRGMR